jgi:hypothetical protein
VTSCAEVNGVRLFGHRGLTGDAFSDQGADDDIDTVDHRLVIGEST